MYLFILVRKCKKHKHVSHKNLNKILNYIIYCKLSKYLYILYLSVQLQNFF